ncbi:MAG TPA: hypothetical protein VJH20_02005 [Candidatus Nanoarchaeia archaeon]|nr:hypothetical protein [Candidatus Nanoarchaeia archaeon]
MEGRLIVVFLVLVLVSSCNTKNEVSENKVTGVTIIEPKGENIEFTKNETFKENKTISNETIMLEEYSARSNILSTENKIKEIYELLIDLEDKNRINQDVMIDAQKRLDKVRDNFNLSYNYYNNKDFIKAKETAIQVKKDAKEIIRTLD